MPDSHQPVFPQCGGLVLAHASPENAYQKLHFASLFPVRLTAEDGSVNAKGGSRCTLEEVNIMSMLRTYKHLLISTKSHLRIIQLNRPTKKNAINYEMYGEIISALDDAAKDENVVITAVTGAGDYYSSGNDLQNYNHGSADPDEMIKQASATVHKFVRTFIEFPKILVAVVNGPAIGIAATTLGLFDVIYASDKASFVTPFTSLGLSAEGCSSYTFPKIMGPSVASEMLYFNKTLTAAEAKQCRFVSEVFPHETLNDKVWPKLEEMSNLPAKSLLYSKALTQSREKEMLLKVVAAECARLEERWQSEECLNAIVQFMQKKSKL